MKKEDMYNFIVDTRPQQAQGPHPLPFKVWFTDEHLPVEVTNPYSGMSCTLKPDAHAVYEVVVAANRIAMAEGRDDPDHPMWDYVRKGTQWFAEHYPEEYYLLLD